MPVRYGEVLNQCYQFYRICPLFEGEGRGKEKENLKWPQFSIWTNCEHDKALTGIENTGGGQRLSGKLLQKLPNIRSLKF